tara:strand:- start:777 stop:1307 length:531 start_codon:yes stop_codon:yes gene_type:complete
MLTKEVNPKGGKLRLVTAMPTEERLEQQAKELKNDLPEAYANRTLQEMKINLLKEYLQETWKNDIYIIMVYRREAADDLVHNPEFKGKCTWLSIRRKDRRPVNNWQDMQTIKNRLCGTECDAIQIFPKESKMVNTANQYHLIVMPEEANIPFGWQTRFVKKENYTGTGVQNFKGDE